MQTNDMLKALDLAKSKIIYADTISKLHSCNDCGLRDCVHRPKLGDVVRINCFAWVDTQKEN